VNENSFGISDLWKFLEARDNSKIERNWNKFLINREGKVVHRYMPNNKPYEVEQDIIKLLKGGKI